MVQGIEKAIQRGIAEETRSQKEKIGKYTENGIKGDGDKFQNEKKTQKNSRSKEKIRDINEKNKRRQKNNSKMISEWLKTGIQEDVWENEQEM